MRIPYLEQENRTEVMGVIHARIHSLSCKAIRHPLLELPRLLTCLWRMRVTRITSDEDTIFCREIGGYTLTNWDDRSNSFQMVSRGGSLLM
jgi:hypothetical protein